MKNLKSKIILIILAVSLIGLLGGCGNRPDVKQNISTIYNFDNCTIKYQIRTAIHIIDWKFTSQECVYLFDRYCDTEKQADSIAVIEYKRAEIVKAKIKECFDM